MALRPPPPALPPRYRLWPDGARAFLGSGGAASVWRVQDQDLGVLVALKVLKDTRPGFLAKMEREAVLASRVVHPNVVAVHDIGRTPDGKGYLAFALASDGTMLDVASKPPPWPELLDLTLQLLEALAAMHARGILHLDVKLSNLLLHRTGAGTQLWLADLGVARALWDDDDDKSVVGTVSYMSPERLTGQHHLWCPSTDLFAVGGVLFRLITGRLPYPARDPSEGLTQRQRPPTKLIPRPGLTVPQGLGQVILPMLQFDRRGRYDLASDAIRAFKHLPPVREGMRAPVGHPNPGGHPDILAPRGVPTWFRPPPVPPPPRLRYPSAGRRVPQAPSLLSQREIALVGREPELELLWRTARTALRTRRPILVEVSGPSGSGRSRLLSAFTRALEEAGLGEGAWMQYAVAEGPNLGLRGSWRRILPPGSRRDIYVREIASAFARDRGSTLEQCYSDARLLSSWLSPTGAKSFSLNRSAIRAMMVEHLERRSWRGLSWLWVEDAHLAGENDDCWAIVDQLMMRDVPALILIDAADDRITPSLLELRARHHKSVRRIRLEPLRGREAEALVQAHLPLDPELTALLVPRASNQPKLVKDLLTHWVRTGQLHEKAGDDIHGRVWTLSGGMPALPPDARALAQARLDTTPLDGPRLDALHALALAGNGTPERVLARVSMEGLDRLVVDGLVDIQQGRCMLQPAALEAVVREQLQEVRSNLVHGKLARAWATEADDPRVALQVGRHHFEAGQSAEALPHLLRSLDHMAATLPVAELRELAERTRTAAEAEGRGSAAWLSASLALAHAAWRGGDPALARSIDAELLAAPLDDDGRMRVLCANIRRGIHTDLDIVPLVAEAEALLPAVRTPRRADFHATHAWVRAARLDVDGALAEVLDALSCRPDPVVGCRARLLRAQLLATIDPMVSWHEALRVVETARDYGLLRYEVVAWGLAADSMVFLGRADEVIERLQSGVQRLEAHGEVRAAHTARLQLGLALMAAGRESSAQEVWVKAGKAPSQSVLPAALDATACLGVLALLRGEPAKVARLCPQEAPASDALRAVWSLLMPAADLQLGDATCPFPSPTTFRRAVALGLPGMFLAKLMVAEAELVERGDAAAPLAAAFQEECAHLGVDPDEAKPWLDRARRSRRG